MRKASTSNRLRFIAFDSIMSFWLIRFHSTHASYSIVWKFASQSVCVCVPRICRKAYSVLVINSKLVPTNNYDAQADAIRYRLSKDSHWPFRPKAPHLPTNTQPTTQKRKHNQYHLSICVDKADLVRSDASNAVSVFVLGFDLNGVQKVTANSLNKNLVQTFRPQTAHGDVCNFWRAYRNNEHRWTEEICFANEKKEPFIMAFCSILSS